MRAAEAAHPDLAIILVSGDGGGTDAGDKPAPPGLLDMADATLPKPYRLADLGAAVERVLGIGG
jgi:hypothetical protein